MSYVKPGDKGDVLYKFSSTSDDPSFYHFINIINYFSNICKVREEDINKILIMIHSDQSADVYINKFDIIFKIIAKNKVILGKEVKKSQIADIQEVYFPYINLQENDCLIYCFKCGWRFGLYFDFSNQYSSFESSGAIEKFNLVMMKRDLSILYRKLIFFDIYDTISNESIFGKMKKDGWFPYIQLIPDDYSTLEKMYSTGNFCHEIINEVIEKYDENKINDIINAWWSKKIFKEKKEILLAGINAFTQGNYINCIKTLTSEIEGILRSAYPIEERKQTIKITQKILASNLCDKANKKSDTNSLLLQDPFKDFLIDFFFSDFDETSDNIPFSRNAVDHGVVSSDKYTKILAFQLIMIIDQIFFLS